MAKPCRSGYRRVRVRGHLRCVKRGRKSTTRRSVPRTMKACKRAGGYTWVRGRTGRKGYCRKK